MCKSKVMSPVSRMRRKTVFGVYHFDRWYAIVSSISFSSKPPRGDSQEQWWTRKAWRSTMLLVM